jgi:Ca2+-binding EF-hand superfamily protein
MEKRTSIDGSRTSFDKKDPPAVQNQPQATNSPPQQQVDLSKFGLPEEESLVTYYSCAIRRTFYRYGWLYITENFMCFGSRMLGETIVIPFKAITTLKKARTNWLLNDSIQVETNEGKTHTFSMFRTRDESFQLIERLWKITMARLLKWAEVENQTDQSYDSLKNFVVTSMADEDVLTKSRGILASSHGSDAFMSLNSSMSSMPDSPLITPRTPKASFDEGEADAIPQPDPDHNDADSDTNSTSSQSGATSDSPTKAHPNGAGANVPPLTIPVTLEDKMRQEIGTAPSARKAILDVHIRNETYQKLFRLPASETLLEESTSSFYVVNMHTNSGGYKKGRIYVSQNFLCFEAGWQIRLIIPLQTIVSLTTDRTALSWSGNAIVVTTHGPRFFFTLPKRDDFFNKLNYLWKSSFAMPINLGILDDSARDIKVGEEFLKLPYQFSANYVPQRLILEERWAQYFSGYGIGAAIIRTDEFNNLVKGGVPDSFRGYIWKLCSGAINRALVAPESYYVLKKRCANQHSTHTEAIDRDVHRSLPEHPYYQTPEGIKALQNVLKVYSWYNPVIGYCQAMNFVAATLLLFMDEESAFWTLCTICEDYMPEYYRPSMVGSIIDIKIFEFLVDYYMPDLPQHLDSFGTPISLISTPWFLSLFIGFIPFELTFRVMDRFFLSGSDVLFRMGLALFKSNKQKLLATDRVEEILSLMRSASSYEPEALLKSFLEDFNDLPTQQIEQLRNRHKFELILNMKDDAKKSKISHLTSTTKFDGLEVESLYDKFFSCLKGEEDQLMSEKSFRASFAKFFPFWKHLVDTHFVDDIFKYFDKNGDQHLDINEFVLTLGQLYKGSLKDRFEFCYGCCDENNDGKVDRQQFLNIMTLFTSLYQVYNTRGIVFERPPEQLAKFVDDTFDTCHLQPSTDEISQQHLNEAILDSGLISSFFILEQEDIVALALNKLIVNQ